MRRLRHERRERDSWIDPVPVDADIGFQPIDPVECKPLDGLRPGRLAEVAQQPAPGGNLQLTAPVEAADRRIETLTQPGIWRIVGILQPDTQRAAKPPQR